MLIQRTAKGEKHYIHRETCAAVSDVLQVVTRGFDKENTAPAVAKRAVKARPVADQDADELYLYKLLYERGIHKRDGSSTSSSAIRNTPGRGGKSPLDGQVWSPPCDQDAHQRISRRLNERPDYH